MLVEVGKLSVDVVMRMLESEGRSPVLSADRMTVSWPGHVYDARKGEVRQEGSSYGRARQIEETTKQIKVGYSKQVIKEQAKRYGWQLKEIAPNKFAVIKRF